MKLLNTHPYFNIEYEHGLHLSITPFDSGVIVHFEGYDVIINN